MLKKKEWLRQLKQLLSKSELLDNFDILVGMKTADYGWNERFSPEGAAEVLINQAKEMAYYG
jgi:hypothetical protein